MSYDQQPKQITLPRFMHPNRVAFEEAGFIFSDSTNSILYNVTLPDGWRMEQQNFFLTYIFDSKGRVRVRSYYKPSFFNPSGSMILLNRFNVDKSDDPNDATKNIISVQDYDKSLLLNLGSCRMYSEEGKSLIKEAEKFLNENYPGWEDPNKYWD